MTDVAVSGHRLSIAGQMIDSRRFSVFIRPSDPLMNFTRFMRKAIRKHKMIGRRVGRDERRPVGLLELSDPSGYTFQVADSLVSLVPRRLSNRVLIRQSRWPNGRRGERRYAGILHFLIGRDGKILVVNQVDAERAAMGVVVSELYPDSQLEAIKAQAVLARGQMLMNIGHRHSGEPFQLCAEHHCQAFHGLGALSPKVAKAVWSTRGRCFSTREIWSRAHIMHPVEVIRRPIMRCGVVVSAVPCEASRMASRPEIYGSKLMRGG